MPKIDASTLDPFVTYEKDTNVKTVNSFLRGQKITSELFTFQDLMKRILIIGDFESMMNKLERERDFLLMCSSN